MDHLTSSLYKILEQDAVQVASYHDYNYLRHKTILITGAAGFIGLNFLSSLNEISNRNLSINVIPVIHSRPSELFLSLISHWKENLICGDLTDEKFIDMLPKADIIIHAAGYGQPDKFDKNSIGILKINTLTTFKLLDKLNEDGRFLFISSSDIYNGLPSGSYSEQQVGTTNTFHSRACYIEGKRAGETMCHLYYQKNIKTYSVRLSLTYGPGTNKNDQRVLPSLIEQGLKTGKISLLDSGNASRSFCYISDAMELFWYILLYGKQNLYNLGGVERATIKSLALLIGEFLNVPVIIPENDNGIAGAPRDVSLNLERLLSEYPKNNFTGLKEGLQKTINWHKNFIYPKT